MRERMKFDEIEHILPFLMTATGAAIYRLPFILNTPQRNVRRIKSLKLMQPRTLCAVSFTFHYGIICHAARIPYHLAIINNRT